MRLRVFFISLLIFFAYPFPVFYELLVILIWKLFICYNGPLFFLYMMNVFPSFEYNVFGHTKVLHFPLILYYFRMVPEFYDKIRNVLSSIL